jgi:hypothetical protein
MSEPVVRKLLPKSAWSARTEAEWEIELDGLVIGRIHEWHARGASATFYDATAMIPGSSEVLRLESSTNFDERVSRIVDAYRSARESLSMDASRLITLHLLPGEAEAVSVGLGRGINGLDLEVDAGEAPEVLRQLTNEARSVLVRLNAQISPE